MTAKQQKRRHPEAHHSCFFEPEGKKVVEDTWRKEKRKETKKECLLSVSRITIFTSVHLPSLNPTFLIYFFP